MSCYEFVVNLKCMYRSLECIRQFVTSKTYYNKDCKLRPTCSFLLRCSTPPTSANIGMIMPEKCIYVFVVVLLFSCFKTLEIKHRQIIQVINFVGSLFLESLLLLAFNVCINSVCPYQNVVSILSP